LGLLLTRVLGKTASARRSPRRNAFQFCAIFGRGALSVTPIALAVLLGVAAARAEIIVCPAAAGQIDEALADIRRSVDPCSESAQLIELLEKVARCSTATYHLCVSTAARRNELDRPIGLPRSITWNPQLRSEIERGCNGDPNKAVLRDPTASLLHELAHAAQDCAGLNPGEHELEAVRIENIYRRAAGLCQRGRYGDVPLPPEMTRECRPGDCRCSSGAPSPRQGETPLRQADGRWITRPPSAPAEAVSSGDQPD
jgi:hypothetical protein